MKLFKKFNEARARKAAVNAMHQELNCAFMSLQAVIRADDEATRKRIATQAMFHIGEAKREMVALGMGYQA